MLLYFRLNCQNCGTMDIFTRMKADDFFTCPECEEFIDLDVEDVKEATDRAVRFDIFKGKSDETDEDELMIDFLSTEVYRPFE